MSEVLQMASQEAARRLYRGSLVWDMTLPGMFSDLNDIATLHRYRSAGVGFVSITIGNDSVRDPEVVVRRLQSLGAKIAAEPRAFKAAHRAADILAARAEGKLAISFHLQGTNGLGGQLANVERFFDLGITHILLAYNEANQAGDGCATPTNAGLTDFGRALVAEMNRVGMLIDGSHSGYRTTMEAMEASQQPFIFSHCNAHAVFAHYRNVRDDQIAACARSGGVVGVNGVGAFLSETGEASAEVIFRHIDHVASLVGPAHVGIALDFIANIATFAEAAKKTADAWPSNAGKPVVFENFAAPEIVLPVTELLCRHGYSDGDVSAILGGNFLRVFRSVVG